MTKPFSMREMEARIRTQIRRTDRILFDLDNRTIIYRCKSVSLSQVEFDLFLILYKNKKRAISSEELYTSLKNGQKDESNAIAVYIRRLRKKFENFDESFGTIETVRNEGYRWSGD